MPHSLAASGWPLPDHWVLFPPVFLNLHLNLSSCAPPCRFNLGSVTQSLSGPDPSIPFLNELQDVLPRSQSSWADLLTVHHKQALLPFSTFFNMVPAARVPCPLCPSLSSDFSLSFKVCLTSHVLQEAFFDVLV